MTRTVVGVMIVSGSGTENLPRSQIPTAATPITSRRRLSRRLFPTRGVPITGVSAITRSSNLPMAFARRSPPMVLRARERPSMSESWSTRVAPAMVRMSTDSGESAMQITGTWSLTSLTVKATLVFTSSELAATTSTARLAPIRRYVSGSSMSPTETRNPRS